MYDIRVELKWSIYDVADSSSVNNLVARTALSVHCQPGYRTLDVTRSHTLIAFYTGNYLRQ